MKRLIARRPLLFAISIGAALGLNACVAYDGGYGRGYQAYDVYYDNHYGPVRDGYWNDDGWFYYRDTRSREWRRDDGRHFRRDAADGYHSSRMHDRRDERGSHRRTRE